MTFNKWVFLAFIGGNLLFSQGLTPEHLKIIQEAFQGGQKRVFANALSALAQRDPRLVQELLLSAKKSEVASLARELRNTPSAETSRRIKTLFSKNRVNHGRLVGELVDGLKKDPKALSKIRQNLEALKSKGIKMPSASRCAAGLSLYIATGDWWHSYYSSFLGNADDDPQNPPSNTLYTTQTIQNMSLTFMGTMCLSEMLLNKHRYKEILDRMINGDPNQHLDEVIELTKLVEENPKDATRISKQKFYESFDESSKVELAKNTLEHLSTRTLFKHTDEAWSEFVFTGELSKTLKRYVQQLPYQKRLEIVAHTADVDPLMSHEEYYFQLFHAESVIMKSFTDWLKVNKGPEEYAELKAAIDSLPSAQQKEWEDFHSINPARKLTLTGLGSALTVLSYQAALGLGNTMIDRPEDAFIRQWLMENSGYAFGALVGGPLVWERIDHLYNIFRGPGGNPESRLIEEFKGDDIPYLHNLLAMAKKQAEAAPKNSLEATRKPPGSAEETAYEAARSMHLMETRLQQTTEPKLVREARFLGSLYRKCLITLTKSR